MCGIVGFVGKKPCKNILINGLKQLEYRGYDSAGIAMLNKKVIQIVKRVGKVEKLVEAVSDIENDAMIGIAHTRWATHGGVTELNAHPHQDCTDGIAVVHNGIIENYVILKQQLVQKGHTFVSETDTEVLAHLIEDLYTGDLFETVKQVIRKVTGTYGIAVLHKDHLEEIIVARHGSPLILGLGHDFSLIASDASAIVEHTDKVIYLNDGEIVRVRAAECDIEDIQHHKIKRDAISLEMKKESTELGSYKHFMLKEIEEQPNVILDTMRGRMDIKKGIAVLGGLRNVEDRLRTIKKIIIVSCGTSYHAGLVGKYMIEEKTDIEVSVENASELRYKKINADPATTMILAISQSGETADTIAALKELKRKGYLTVGIVNVVGSSIAREVHAGVYTHAGFEIGVASTKAFTTQIVILVLLMVYMGRMRNMSLAEGQEILKALVDIPEKIRLFLDTQKDAVKKNAEKYKDVSDFLYLGRKYNYPIALEGALKLKEISYIHAEGYAAGEMKHGPIAMIDENFPSLFIAVDDEIKEKVVNAIEEIKARKGPVVAVITKGDEEMKKYTEDVMEIEPTISILTPLLSIIPQQLFAYYVADALGRDIDKPRNLAKSVTVE